MQRGNVEVSLSYHVIVVTLEKNRKPKANLANVGVIKCSINFIQYKEWSWLITAIQASLSYH